MLIEVGSKKRSITDACTDAFVHKKRLTKKKNTNEIKVRKGKLNRC